MASVCNIFIAFQRFSLLIVKNIYAIMKKIFILFRCMLAAGLFQCSFVAQAQEPVLAPTAIVYPEMRGSLIETYECPAFDVDA